ncbi:MAG TPA: zinc metallopeptidase [Hyphomicrobiaceae bacterium]|nr:zinc metallopeptidase [Hyphomicrobiaceae bacterium]
MLLLGFVLVILAMVFGLAFLPQMWVRGVISRHSAHRPDLPGTGGEFARHLLDRMGLQAVKVEETTLGDHYDPETKAVRLLPAHMNGRSLAAVVIAAHEVGHAMQDATGYPPLHARTRLAKQAQRFETIGAVVMLAAPLVMVLAKSPHLLIMEIFVGVLILSMTILIHAVTLPMEFDASFRRALPVLKAGGYIKREDVRAARQILRAAAFTYVAAAALSLLDVMRWLRVLRL